MFSKLKVSFKKSDWGKNVINLSQKNSRNKTDRKLARTVKEIGIYYANRHQALQEYKKKFKHHFVKTKNPYHFEKSYVDFNNLDKIGHEAVSGVPLEDVRNEIFRGSKYLEEPIFRARMVKYKLKHPKQFEKGD